MYKVISVTCSIESRKTFEETVPYSKQIQMTPDKERIISCEEENSSESELCNVTTIANILEGLIWYMQLYLTLVYIMMVKYPFLHKIP